MESIQCFLQAVVGLNNTVCNIEIYLAPLLTYGTPNILGSRFDFCG